MNKLISNTITAALLPLSMTTLAANSPPGFDDSDNIIALSVSEDATATTIAGISVTDTDSSNTLTWSQGTTAPTQGATSFAGTSLGGASKLPSTYTYTPTANANGADTFTIDVSDAQATDTLTVNVTITSVNDAPTVASTPTSITVVEDVEGNVDLSTTVFAEVDNETITATFAIDAGMFSTPLDGAGVGGGVTETLASATSITLAGAAADINTYLDAASNIKYTGALNTSGNSAATITISAVDSAASALASNPTVSINITAANDLPTLGGTFTTAGVVNDNVTTTPFSSVTVSDIDGDNVSVTITYTGENGTLSSPSGGLTANSAGNYTIDSTAAATAQTKLQALVFTPTTNQSATTTVTAFTLTPNDGTGDGAANATTQVTASAVAPSVSSVSVPSNTTYATAGNLDFTVNTSEAVTVTGTPRLTLTIGATTKYATYLSGTGTTALVYRYTVESGLTDSDGISVAGTVDVNGGTLKDSGGKDLTAALNSVGALTSVLIDSVAPTLTIVTIVSNNSDTTKAKVGDVITVTIVSSEALSANPVVTIAGNAATESSTDSTSYTATYTMLSGDTEGVVPFTIDFSDVATNTGVQVIASKDSSAVAFDRTASTTTISAIDISADTGTSDADFETATAAQTITGTLSTGLVTGEILYGSVDAGSTWTNVTANVSATTAISWDATLSGSSSIQFKITDASNNDGTVATQAYVIDTAVPTLSAISSVNVLDTTVDLKGTSNEVGNMYFVITTSATPPSNTQVIAGQSNTGSVATKFANSAVTAATAKTFNVTGLTNATQYYYYIVATDAVGNESTVSNGGFTTTSPPVITSNSGGATASINVAENSTAVTTVVATDADVGDIITYTKSGADSARFSLSSTGVLTFISAPDFETPTDNGATNTYEVTVTATDNGAGTLSDSQNITVSVTNVDNVVTLTTSTATVVENGGTSIITATSASAASANITVNLAYTGTATKDTDYTSAASITILAGQTTGTTTLTSIADTIFDAPSSETAIIAVSSVSGGEGKENGSQTQTVTITDDEVTPVVTLQVSDNTINEDGGTASITAILNNATYAHVTVNLSLSNTGTATSDADYTLSSTSLTIMAGDVTGDAVPGITSVNDNVEEGDETIIIDVSTISDGSATENGAQQQTITITDDDDTTPPVFDSTPVLSNITVAGATLAVDIDEQGDVYYIVVDQGVTPPTAVQTKAPINYTGATVHASGTIATTSTTGTANIVGLSDAIDYTVYVVAQDTNANLQANASVEALTLTTDDISPNIASITLSGPPAATAPSITYNVVFSDDVSNVDITDFTLTLVSGATNVTPVISSISGTLKSYTVNITTGVTVGVIRLDLNAGTDIVDESSNTTPDGYTGGDVHSVDTNLSPTIIEQPNPIGIFTIDEDVKTSLDLSDVFTADDNGDEITVTLSSDNGLLFAKDGNVTVSSTTIAGSSVTGTSSITLTGLGNDINTFLDDVTRILFQTTLNNTDVSTLTITSDDWFEAGTGLSKTITINAINDAPTISGVPATSVVDGNAYSFTPTASDIENETLSFAITNPPTWASFDTATGELIGNPTPAHVGTTSGIVIRVEDPSTDGNDLASFNIEVIASNAAPVISQGINTTVVMNEDGAPTAFSLTLNATDANNDPLTWSINNQATKGSATVAGTGNSKAISYTPNSHYFGVDSFAVKVSDGLVNDTITVNVTVSSVNDLPNFTSTGVTAATQDSNYNYNIIASDSDDSTLAITATTKPTWLTVADNGNGTATLSGLPTNANVGNNSVVLSVIDNEAGTAIQSFTVVVSNTNDAPVITGTPATTAVQDVAYSFTPSVTDVDTGDTHTFSITNKPSWAAFNTTTGALTGTPANDDVGVTSNVVITATDSAGAAASLTVFSVTVSNTNDAPVITGTPATTVAQDEAYRFTPSVSDVDAGDTHTFSITNQPSWTTFNTTTGALTGTPTNDDVGVTAGIVITATDSAGANASLTTFNVTVSNTNDAPVITGTPTITVAQDVAYSFTPSVSDVDAGDTQTFSITNQPSWATFNSTTGALTGTPSNDDVGVTAGVVITATDSASATASLTAFSVTVSNTNDAPVITGTPATTVAQDVAYRFTPSVSDVDTDDTHAFSITNKPSWAGFSATTGALTGKPSNDHVGVTSGIVITATDSAGAAASLTAFSVTVSNTNEAPVMTGTPATTVAQDTSYSFTPSLSDVDAGDTHTFSITNQPSWAAFSATTGALTGTPSNNDVGVTAGVVITATDSAGATASLTAFSVTVSNTNDAPVITGTPATTVAKDVAYRFTPSVSDVDAGDTQTFSITNQPSWAGFSATTGALTGTPTNDDVGVTSGIVITATDSAGAAASLTPFNIEVIDINQAPVAADVSETLAEDSDTSVTLTATDNDAGDEFTFVIASEPLHGSLTASLDNTAQWQYTPDADYQGEDSFTYTANDGDADSVPATVTLTITSVNDAPVATDDDITLPFDETGVYVLDVLGNDSDIENDELTITNASASIGSVSIDNNQLVYQAQAGVQGVISLDYVINDGHPTQDKGSAQARVTLFIDGGINAQLPVITLPEDVIVNATGLFTKVDLGVATAVDNAGQILPVSLVDGSTLFRPGNNVAYWQAEDSQGLKSVASQSVIVHPLITMSRDKTSVEGTSHDVFIYLNGAAPLYPVTIGYSVSGSADANDHKLISGDIVIDSGEVGSISFDVLADDMAEDSETLTITLDDTLNLGAGSAYTLTIAEQNIAPQVTYSVMQDNEQRLLIENNAGQVVIETEVSDSNTLDTHQYQWLDSDSELVDVDNDETTYTFDATGLTAGIQILSLVVTDNGDTPLSTTTNIYLVITEVLVVLTDVDSDGDLIPDNEEGLGDDDLDGIPNYLDVPSACNVMPQQVGESQVFLVEGESGVCLRKGATVADNKSGGLELAPDEVPNDEDTLNVGGIFDFIAYGLSEAGQSYNLVLPQRRPIPANALYRKLTPINGWVDFVVDVNNQVASSQGSLGFCPPPADASWSIGLSEGHWCVQLTIEDGGPNDDDGLANGSIDDPGGVAVLISTNHFPVAEAETTSTAQNTPITIDVLRNDSDEDNDFLTIDSASADFGVVDIAINIQQLIYTPPINFIGVATINYGVSDGNGGTSYANVTVNIIENQAPVTQNDTARTDDKTAIIIAPLTNDSDSNDDTLTLISADAEQGSISIDTDNTLTYTPKAGFDGKDIITYTIDDGNGGQAIGQITVTVTVTNTSSGGGAMAWWFIGIVSLLAYRRKWLG